MREVKTGYKRYLQLHRSLNIIVKPPYNDIGYITISSILRSKPLINPFLV